ncbi:hypothetical protein LIER_21588 [Lithospermum erythrorhizon]|uniref:Uncharacterized protein n=1 Tax=Lithospermum erythrorhizon TaxID=34254 RepID=A0AAV3QQW5_LITER
MTQRRAIMEIFKMREVVEQGKYLGLPSQIGKEILLKLAASTIPNYLMKCFKLPLGIIEEINKVMARYFWVASDKETGIHWKRLELMCNSKFEGGLGFKDLECINLALLARQGWKVATQQAFLLYKVLKGRYFRNTSFLKAKIGSKASFG